MMLARALYAAGDYGEAIEHATVVRDFLGSDLERGYIAGAMNQTASSRTWLTFMLAEVGAFDEAERNISRTLSFLPSLRAAEHDTVWAVLAQGRLRLLQGDDAAVVEVTEPRLEVCRSRYPVYLPRMAMSLGPALVHRGQPERGIALLAEADALGEVKSFLFLRSLLLSQFASSLLFVGEIERAALTADRARKIAITAGEAGNAAWAMLAIGEVALARGRKADGRAMIEQAAEEARRRAMVPLLGRCAEVLEGSN